MDYNNHNDREMWDWDSVDYGLQEAGSIDVSKSLWNGVSQNEDNLSYMFDETTPIRACGDMAYDINNAENVNKEMQHCRENSSQLKRRRMLQFDNADLDIDPFCKDIDPFCKEDISSVFLKTKEREGSVNEDLSDMSQWVSVFADDTSPSGCEGVDQTSEGWLDDCINDTDMHFNTDDMNLPGTSSVQINNPTENRNNPIRYEANMVQEHPVRPRRNIVVKGRKSYMRTPTKLATSVIYPFAFVKPCAVRGDVTLKDINQKILTPPPSKSKQKEDAFPLYPTSAITGKPVVGKTKIRTEGGKGSITIMRTKG